MIKEENSIIKEYDKDNNLIHYKDSDKEYWNEYDKNNNIIHHKEANGYEYWQKFDGIKLIGYKDTLGSEYRDTSIMAKEESK